MKLPSSGRKYSFTFTQLVVSVLIIAGVAYWAGNRGVIPYTQPVYDSRAPENVDLAPLFTAWHLLDQNFVPAGTSTATTSAQDHLWGAIQGLAASYGDDYTVFFPPVQKQIFETSINGDFEGVGMEIGLQGGALSVVAPIKDTPAERAGILQGDIITAINSVSTRNMSVDEAVSRIRGPKGSKVILTISRAEKNAGKPFDVPVVRDTIILPTTDTKDLGNGIFKIALYNFDSHAPQAFAEALNEFQASGDTKLIVDLRGNPGGYLEAAGDIASWFLPQGAVVVTQHSGAGPDQVYTSRGYSSGVPSTDQVVVLVNGGSASAAEILAGALQDHERATIIGSQSFGKGSVQQVFNITDATALKITIARWLTPNGTSISHKGITPDIAVDLTPEDTKAKKDPQLDRAVQFLTTGK